MSHITLAQQGLAAVQGRQWDEAVTKLSTALATSENPAWLIGRSKALAGLKRFHESLQDAELAWNRAYERNKRPLLAEAHYRRAVAFYSLGRYADADACCIYAMRMIKGHSALEKEDPALEFVDEKGCWSATADDARLEAQSDEINTSSREMGMPQMEKTPQAMEWRMASTIRIQALTEMAKLAEDDPARRMTTQQRPALKSLATVTMAGKVSEKTPEKSKGADFTVQAVKVTEAAAVPHETPLRLQEFQSNTAMSVSIFSKGVDKDALRVEFLPKSVRMYPVVYPSGGEREFQLDLWGEIKPDLSQYVVTPNKIELTMPKKNAGKWPTLKAEPPSAPENKSLPASDAPRSSESGSASTASPTDVKATSTTSTETATTAPTSKKPSYPTSSRSGPKNWDQVGAEVDDDADEPDVNGFFKKLYKQATPEQQRAMMKSFTESSGTTLSTDWHDVKSRTVPTRPPEGVEAKKWE